MAAQTASYRSEKQNRQQRSFFTLLVVVSDMIPSNDNDTQTSNDYRTTATLLWLKVRNLIRLSGLLLFLVGVWHFMGTIYLGLPSLEIYNAYVPEMIAVTDSGGAFDAGHLIPMVIGAILVWFTPS